MQMLAQHNVDILNRLGVEHHDGQNYDSNRLMACVRAKISTVMHNNVGG